MEIIKIDLPFGIKKPVLAFGAQTKNTVCFAKANTAYLTCAHGDLSNPRNFTGFEKSVKYFLGKNPEIIACDLHPEYQSTKAARELESRGCKLLAIQHHHSHIASCMAENELKNQKVIGIAFDGTGLGEDNTLWGAEILVCDYKSFERRAHLKEVPLLGAEMAILEPYRSAFAWLRGIYGVGFSDLNLGLFKTIEKKKLKVIEDMYLKKINSPLSSSMGRLFDAVASLVLEKPKAAFEAELAIKLEFVAKGCRRLEKAAGYPFSIISNNGAHVIDPAPMFKKIIADLTMKRPKEKIAYKFHLTVALMIEKICLMLRKETLIDKIALSGGVFLNKALLGLTLDLLYDKKFKVYTHNALSCSDLSVSFGQAVIAGMVAAVS